MTTINHHTLKAYRFSIILILSIVLGGFAGYYLDDKARLLKPIGDIFLNLILTTIVPLIFFSVSSAIARTGSLNKLGRIMASMIGVFIFTGIIAALFLIAVVILFPPALGTNVPLSMPTAMGSTNISKQLVAIFTVKDFTSLFSHNHILALIVFSMLVGIATLSTREKGKSAAAALQTGEMIMMRAFDIIMYFAPIGFFAYFAVIVSELGPQLMESYLRIGVIYYVSALLYLVIAFTGYAYLAGKMSAVKLFWGNVTLPATTALGTCSSAASIPANLIAAKAMRVEPAIYEPTIPLGAIIHKDGSVMGGVIKIAFLFGIFHLSFSGLPVILTALGVSLLVGTVMGAIPSGGLLGEILILNMYGFPSTALLAIAAISIIIDPPATLLNVTGDCVASMLVARLVDGKKWFLK